MIGTPHIVVVDPFSTGAAFCDRLQRHGIPLVRVLSAVFPERQVAFVPPGVTLHFSASIQHLDSVTDTVAAVRALQVPIAGVVACCETAVELADAIAFDLGLPSNCTELSACRRDKFLMQERLRSQLPPEQQLLAQMLIEGHDAQITTPLAEIREFLQLPACAADESGQGPFAVVVKPLRSCGSDQVTFCSSEAEVLQAATAIIGHKNLLGTTNTSAVLQSFLRGTEYVVDSVSFDGVHKTTAVWRYRKQSANGSRFVYSHMHLVGPDSDAFCSLVQYAHQVLDALGIRFGPSHAEIMLTQSGPALIEVGARFHGVKGSFIACVDDCIGYNQVDVTASIFTFPDSWMMLPAQPPALLKHGLQIFLIASVEGVVRELPLVEQVRAVPSFLAMNLNVQPGDRLERTDNGWSSCGNVTLVNADAVQLGRDLDRVLALANSPDFYVLEP
eukprot:gnl/Spiro4/4526_TR2251_c0_g1_i1.p1 gnl/Spiro4/4526_TR2251_c0_g1~~gnl/Spiro4/4526_TR2251_c0_g1_i1.p1  ORF type:complete len:474 (-),score=124.86 gnl/Spiro4/4526_TR2251_c0_g1_i1:117-1451(-)